MLLQAIVCRLPYSVLCLLATLSVWQVRTFRTPAFAQSTLRCPKSTRIKQSLLRRLSFQKCFTSQPFKDVLQSRPPLVSRHPIPFATPQQQIAPISLPCGFACQQYSTVASRPLAHAHFNATASRKPTVLPRHGVHAAFQLHRRYQLLKPAHFPTSTSIFSN